jgi:hypothetical protein
MHMPLAISIRDLHDIILARLHIKNGEPLPAEIHIPSYEWIRLQFWPTNSTTAKAIRYTGRYQVKFKVQGRLLRKKSVDAHYCAAIFRYLREFLIQYQQWACFISADDKHKVPIGENVPVSTGVRNRRSLTTQNNDLNASDHDFTKLSLTPSVIFLSPFQVIYLVDFIMDKFLYLLKTLFLNQAVLLNMQLNFTMLLI